MLERVEPQRRMQTWGELLGKSNKFAVRLDMYLSMSKKTRKYGGGKENLHKL